MDDASYKPDDVRVKITSFFEFGREARMTRKCYRLDITVSFRAAEIILFGI